MAPAVRVVVDRGCRSFWLLIYLPVVVCDQDGVEVVDHARTVDLDCQAHVNCAARGRQVRESASRSMVSAVAAVMRASVG